MREEERISILLDALRIYSPTGNEEAMARYLFDLLRSNGFDVTIDPVGNVIATRGHGEPVIWLHAHMDTVPGPLDVYVRDGRIFGRGASDDKGPLMAMVAAFMEHDPAEGTVNLVAVVDEEGESRGTKYLLKHGVKPSAVIVGEPTGVDRVVVKYRGNALVEVLVRTRGGHASNPDFESNAILRAFSIYERVREALGAGSSYDEYLVMPTVISGGAVYNAIPDSCRLVINIRIPPRGSCDELMSRLGMLDPSSIRVVTCTEPVEVDVNNPAVRAVSRGIIKVLGRRPVLARKLGTSDMNELAVLTGNMVAYGPGNGVTSHSMEESIDIGDYLASISVYKEALSELPRLLHGDAKLRYP